ncbi:MAG: hypothetical protein ABSA11_16855 [Candidatus Bathyarchaeia archaeon]|jgi:hypothetical protein
MSCWQKFKPIIEKYRGWEWPSDVYSNWEYLADALEDLQIKRDTEYKEKVSVMLSTHVDGVGQ